MAAHCTWSTPAFRAALVRVFHAFVSVEGVGSAAPEQEFGTLLVRYAGLLPRMLGELGLSDQVGYQVQSRATEILEKWLRRGQDKSAMTSTVAAAALWMAKEALAKGSGAASVALSKIEMAAVANAAGLKSIDPIRKLLTAYADKPPMT